MRVGQQELHRPGQQGALAVEGFGNRCLDLRVVSIDRTEMLLHRQERKDHVELAGLFLELADQGQVGDHETGGRFGHDVLAKEPVDQAIVEFQVGRQVAPPQNRAAQDLGEMLVAVETILTLGQQQGDIGIVSPGQVITHKQVGVRVLDANALVVADFTVDRRRPVADVAAGTR